MILFSHTLVRRRKILPAIVAAENVPAFSS
jgi:hypothetical protein